MTESKQTNRVRRAPSCHAKRMSLGTAFVGLCLLICWSCLELAAQPSIPDGYCLPVSSEQDSFFQGLLARHQAISDASITQRDPADEALFIWLLTHGPLLETLLTEKTGGRDRLQAFVNGLDPSSDLTRLARANLDRVDGQLAQLRKVLRMVGGPYTASVAKEGGGKARPLIIRQVFPPGQRSALSPYLGWFGLGYDAVSGDDFLATQCEGGWRIQLAEVAGVQGLDGRAIRAANELLLSGGGGLEDWRFLAGLFEVMELPLVSNRVHTIQIRSRDVYWFNLWSQPKVRYVSAGNRIEGRELQRVRVITLLLRTGGISRYLTPWSRDSLTLEALGKLRAAILEGR